MLRSTRSRVGHYVATDRPSHSVGRYVATDPAWTMSLRSDRTVSDIDQQIRPKSVHSRRHSVGRYVATDPAWTMSLRSDRTVSDIDQQIRPKSVHSRLFLNARSHVPQPYHFSHHSDQSHR
ncbi:hypothetical protein F2Q68_00011537 [Brassica cretica]|uniref:Uncharacterized protein n=1 Tax=Brassica cretica TaxID=69181 RepID=A0A8S9L6B6_BRACR|nr:hypothetical protein F2Q68_00011537 [Brassica cretica]